MKDHKIRIGNSNLEITPIIFGGNVFGWTLDEQQSYAILDKFIDLGFNSIDTANNYSHWVAGNKGGESETIIGNWLKSRGNRTEIILMTKVGGRFDYDSKPDISAKNIKIEIENSLTRLKTDYIDLYQTHYDNESTPVEETLRTYEDLIKEGKIRYIGASNISKERLTENLVYAEKNNLPKYISLQPEYNLFDRQKYESQYAKLVAEEGIAVIPYYSLASGFLTGKYTSDEDFKNSARGDGIQKRYWNDRGIRILKELKEVANTYNTTQSAIALAWLLARPGITAPIASGSKESHLQSFLDAIQLELDVESLQKLNHASAY